MSSGEQKWIDVSRYGQIYVSPDECDFTPDARKCAAPYIVQKRAQRLLHGAVEEF